MALIHAEVKDSALGTLLTPLTNSKETVGWRKRYEVDAFCAFRARNEELSVLLNVVDNHVMTSDVYQLFLFNNEQVVLDLAVNTENKSGS